jgi:hypothetical protein
MYSTRKPEMNAPVKKNRTYSIYNTAVDVFLLMSSSAKNAKWPVRLVVRVWTAKKPAIFTIPATKDSSEASLRLCIKVRLLPSCLNING